MSTLADVSDVQPVPCGFFDSLARRMMLGQLSQLRNGQITLTDSVGTERFGETSDLQVTLRVHRSRMFRDAVCGGSNSVAESYFRGDWDCDDLTALFRIFVRNSETGDRLDRGLARLAGIGHRLYHWWRSNSRNGSRQNIQAHYDLGNAFYRLWLDDTLAYSCGFFAHADATLHEASVEKFDRVCRKLDLNPDDQVLEIGTGWGGFALHAAGRYGCRVTTTTISESQLAAARVRVTDAGLADRVTLLRQDYRDLSGQFDRLVSIEMIEAVGHRYLDDYFRKCGELLRPDGSFVLQAIVMPERRHAQYLKSVDFLQRYVFPGGCLPSVAAVLEAVGRTTDLRLVHVEDFAPHYVQTLRRWRLAFNEHRDEVRRLGHSEEFCRLWNYYLCYCEAAFAERYIGLVQIQFDKPQCRRDPIRLSERAAHFDVAGHSAPAPRSQKPPSTNSDVPVM